MSNSALNPMALRAAGVTGRTGLWSWATFAHTGLLGLSCPRWPSCLRCSEPPPEAPSAHRPRTRKGLSRAAQRARGACQPLTRPSTPALSPGRWADYHARERRRPNRSRTRWSSTRMSGKPSDSLSGNTVELPPPVDVVRTPKPRVELLQTFAEGPAAYVVCSPSPGDAGPKRYEGELVQAIRRESGYVLVIFEGFGAVTSDEGPQSRDQCWILESDLRRLPEDFKVDSLNHVDKHVCAPTYGDYIQHGSRLSERTFAEEPPLPHGWQRLKPGQTVRVLDGKGYLLRVMTSDGICWANTSQWKPLSQ